MPELPDVEDFRRHIETNSMHKKIKSVVVKDGYVLDNIRANTIAQQLKDRSFESTRRHGKHLFVALDKGGYIRFHFGMTGYLQHLANGADEPEHTRIRFDFVNGDHLAYSDLRKLGKVGMLSEPQDFIDAEQLGRDAAELSLAQLESTLADRRGSIKTALMDQTLIAGIGNVYSDEILFQSGIRPDTEVAQLSKQQIKRIYDSMREVLSTSISLHADPDVLPRSYLIPNRHKNSACPKCRAKLKTAKSSGRTAWYCPRCQPAKTKSKIGRQS